MKSIALNHTKVFGDSSVSIGELTTLNVASMFSKMDPMKVSQKIGKGEAQQILRDIGMGNTNLSKWV